MANKRFLFLFFSPVASVVQPPGFPALRNGLPEVYKSRAALTHDQFVLALKHALTKEAFVSQLYEAYQEVSGLYEDS